MKAGKAGVVVWWTAGVLLASTGACLHTHRVAEKETEGSHAAESKTEQGASPRVTPKRIPPRGDRPAVAASPEGLMNPGSARRIQEALHGRGYLDEVSGELDVATSQALRRFQSDQGLASTGAPDRETLRHLGVDPGDVYQTGRGSTGHGKGS